MAAISQTIFSYAFSWMKSFVLWLKFHWSLFLKTELTRSQQWFGEWLGAEEATSHYLNKCLPVSLMLICGTRGDELTWWGWRTNAGTKFGSGIRSAQICEVSTSLIARFMGANMGPIWGRQDPGGPHVGPMNLAIWVTCVPSAVTQ